MRRLLTLALLLSGCLALAVLSTSPVHAISATCLPDGFPSTPTPPVFGMDIAAGYYSPEPTQFYHIDLWRVACQDGSGVVVLLRITPQSDAPQVCSYDFKILQLGQTTAVIRQTPDGYGFCDELLVPVTFVLDRDPYSGSPTFDPAGALTLAIQQFSSTTTAASRYARLEVPAADGALGITVVSTGCSSCSAGQTATFHIHVVNPGPPMDVALKAGLRLPNNGTFSLLGAQAEEVALESGESDIPLTNIVVPGAAPNGTYIIEAAILDPIFGGTFSRHAVSVTKQ